MARLRAVALEDLALLLGALAGRPRLTVRAARMVVARWQALGLAQAVANPRGGNAIVVASRDGWEWAVGSSPATVGLPAWRDMPHTLSVAAVAIHLIATTSGTRWISEHDLREKRHTHCPDGALVLGDGRTYAIEVERVQKSATRWQDIIGAHLTDWAGVTYYCRGSTAPALTRWATTHLPAHDRERLVIVDLGSLAR